MTRVWAPLVAFLLAATGAVAATSPADQVAAAARRIAEVGAELAGAAATDDRITVLTRAITAYEAALASLRAGVIEAGAREREIAIELRARRSEITQLLAVLESMSRTPPPVQAMHPGGPLGAARAAGMLALLTPALQAEAVELAGELDAIDAARALRRQGLADLEAGLAAAGAARGDLMTALAAQALPPPEPDPVAKLMMQDSDTLTAFAEKLDGLSAGTPEGTGPLALAMPVSGAILRGFDEPDAAGVRRPGLLVEAAPLALVTAPAPARVRYAGPFLDYGYVVVLEPRADVLIVLAGLATVEVRAGAVLEAGALIGLLGGQAPDAEDFLMMPQSGTGVTAGETLYIEIRQGQGPVDPAPWFASRNG